jgi:hypothetical protein
VGDQKMVSPFFDHTPPRVAEVLKFIWQGWQPSAAENF